MTEGTETIVINARGEHIEVPVDIVKKYFGIPITGNELYVNYRAEEVHKVLDEILQNNQQEEKHEALLNDKKVLADLKRNDSIVKLRLNDVLTTDEKEDMKVNINFDKELFVCDFNFNKVTEKIFEGKLKPEIHPLVVRLNRTTRIIHMAYSGEGVTKTDIQFYTTDMDKRESYSIAIGLQKQDTTVRDAVIYALKNNLILLTKFYPM